MVLLIEICRMDKSFGKNKWFYREGSVKGAIDMSNVSKKDILQEISRQMDEERID